MAYVKVAMEAKTDIDYIGASTDTDPTDVFDGALKYDTDTGLTQITKNGGTTWVNFTKPGEPVIKVPLVNDASYSLPNASSGFAVIKLGDTNSYRSAFYWDVDGNFVDIESDYSKTAYADTDGYLCIINTAGQVTIRNRTGSPQTLKILRLV